MAGPAAPAAGPARRLGIITRMPASPPPAAPPFTDADADRWRAARTWRRLEARWLAVLPLAVCLLAMLSDPAPTGCSAPASCLTPWTETATGVVLLAEAMLLLVRPRRPYLVPAAVAVLIWLMPTGLPDAFTRWTALTAHVLLALALLRADAGRRRARRILDLAAGPAVPYPWTAVGAARPPLSAVPVGRCLTAALALAAAIVLAVTGHGNQRDSDALAARAAPVEATVLSTDAEGLTARVGYTTPGTGQQRTADLDVWWDPTPHRGDRLPLLADDDGFARLVGDPYDPASWYVFGGLAATAAALLLSSAVADVRRRRAFSAAGAPALRVLVSQDAKGDTLVRPAGAPTAAPLWRFQESNACLWWPGRDAEGWVPEYTVAGYRHAGTEHDGTQEAGTGNDGSDGTADALRKPGPVSPPVAARAADRAARPTPALLFHGPDGPSAQLLVRPGHAGARWRVSVTGAFPGVPRWWRRGRPLGDDDDAVSVLAGASLADADARTAGAAEPADTGPEPARVVGMPRPLRLAAGPLLAVPAAVFLCTAPADGWFGGLVRPLLTTSAMFVALVTALTWQAGFDREGLVVASGLRVRRWSWDEVNAAAVHRGRLSVQGTDGSTVHIWAWPAAPLGRHLGGAYAPAAVAETVTVLAHRPARRPTTALPGRVGTAQVLLNRSSLAAVVLCAVGWYVVRAVTGS